MAYQNTAADTRHDSKASSKTGCYQPPPSHVSGHPLARGKSFFWGVNQREIKFYEQASELKE